MYLFKEKLEQKMNSFSYLIDIMHLSILEDCDIIHSLNSALPDPSLSDISGLNKNEGYQLSDIAKNVEEKITEVTKSNEKSDAHSIYSTTFSTDTFTSVYMDEVFPDNQSVFISHINDMRTSSSTNSSEIPIQIKTSDENGKTVSDARLHKKFKSELKKIFF